MFEFIEKGQEEFFRIFSRFRKRDFSGNEGQAIKNSSYQLITLIVSKVGSLLFTIIIARLLMPELFGLYSLSLATILLFASFADLGLGNTLMTFVSKSLEKRNYKKAKAYFKKLVSYKFYLSFFATLILLSLSYYLANNYYNKPIFLALLAGAIYIPVVSFWGFFEIIFKASNNFKYPFIKEIIFQIIRVIVVPISIFLLLKTTSSNSLIVMTIILILTLCYGISFLYLILNSKKKLVYIKYKSIPLTKIENKELIKFILPLTATALSGVFFGYIDTILLGHFVKEEFIGYYSSAINLIGSAAAVFGFIGMAVFPIFARLKGKNLENAFQKTARITFFISLFGAIIAFSFANLIIKLTYGINYLTATPLLKIFSLLLIFFPLSSIYESYLISIRKPSVMAKLLIGTTILNIILNYLFITYGLRFSMTGAIIGSCIAVVISRFVYFIGLNIYRRKISKDLSIKEK